MIVLSFIDKKCEDSNYLSKIDEKVSSDARSVLNDIRFLVKSCVDLEENAILNDLRKILEDKLRGSDCYADYSTETMLSIIKKRIR